MTSPITSRRSFLGLAAASTFGAVSLAACGSSGPAQPGGAASSGGGGGGGNATMWGLTGKPGETIRKNAVDAFNKLGKGTIEVTTFQNDPYKAKIRTAIGAGEAPTLIFGWGGGILKSYADASQVDDLTSWIEGDLGFQGQVPALDVGRGDVRQEDLRGPDPDDPADRHVLQQVGLRQGRRAAADRPGMT